MTIESVTQDGAPVPVKTTTENGFRHLRVGDPGHTITGLHRYQLLYTVRGGPISFADHDELYWDVIASHWDVPIDNARITVIAPAAVGRVTCFVGPDGSALPCDHASANGLTATFTQAFVATGSGVTVVVGMPKRTIQPPAAADPRGAQDARDRVQGHAVDDRSRRRPDRLGLATVIGLGTMRGRDRRFAGSEVDAAMGNARATTSRYPCCTGVSGVIEFVPPDNIRPGEIGMLADEHANLLDVTATIVDLAVRGFLKITEVDPERHERHPDYELAATTDKDRGTLLPYEQHLLSKLFDNRDRVKLSALKYKFRTSLIKDPVGAVRRRSHAGLVPDPPRQDTGPVDRARRCRTPPRHRADRRRRARPRRSASCRLRSW